MRRSVCAAVLLGVLAGCSQPGVPMQKFSRSILSGPGNAQPSKIVAREIAMLKRAGEIGQIAAAKEFAAADALVLSQGGPIALADLPVPPDDFAVAPWTPKTVWVSCDASFAVSEGRFETASGAVGDYITTWRFDRALREYALVHNAASLDDPQPRPRPAPAAPVPGEIVVDAMIAVEGHVADCKPAPGAPPQAAGGAREERARDGTLTFRYDVTGTERILAVNAWAGGAWTTVLERRWPNVRK